MAVTVCGLLLLHCGVALAAIYRSVIAGLEGNLSLLATVCTYCREELFLRSCGVLSRCAAFLASLGLVLEAFLCVEFLLTGCENEFLTTVLAH